MPCPPLDVVVVIVSHNGRSFLVECLMSVLGSADGLIRRQIVVVDNASTDGSRELVREQFPNVTIIASDQNLGFAGGANLGARWALQSARPRFLAMLNQDTV